MIKMFYKNNQMYPLLYCDYSGEQIANIDDAIAMVLINEINGTSAKASIVLNKYKMEMFNKMKYQYTKSKISYKDAGILLDQLYSNIQKRLDEIEVSE